MPICHRHHERSKSISVLVRPRPDKLGMGSGLGPDTHENHEMIVPKVPLREEVEVHLVPDAGGGALEVRIWWDNRMVQSVAYPLKDFPGVHFSSFPNSQRCRHGTA